MFLYFALVRNVLYKQQHLRNYHYYLNFRLSDLWSRQQPFLSVPSLDLYHLRNQNRVERSKLLRLQDSKDYRTNHNLSLQPELLLHQHQYGDQGQFTFELKR